MSLHKRGRLHLEVGWRHFTKQVFKVIRNPIFAVMTIVGNSFVFIASLLFYHFENGRNSQIDHWFDAFWWATATVTTVGYGDITPVTTMGRIIGIGLMITGGTLFLSFIALFSSAFVELEIGPLEEEISNLRGKIDQLSKGE